MADYAEVLLKTEAEWDEIVERWKAKKLAEKQAPIVRKERIKRGIWENLFAYGVMLGVLVQVALWLQWLEVIHF